MLTLFAATALCAEQTQTRSVACVSMDRFELNRYLGEWYEIARYDHRFERGLTHVRALYRQRNDGLIEVVNSGFDPRKGQRHEAYGKARTTAVPGHLSVSFFWIFGLMVKKRGKIAIIH